ncbi:MAG TPA: pantoate--beta-alanine ligase [Dehalococcoidia bacterium]|nr:pantoate--beta-alanine ligase [Dehalococcoidia bacterium]
MKTVETIAGYREIRSQLYEPIGFVPTMGYLHEGHLSLVKRAREENRTVVVSIFVNPTQFGPDEDLKNYPRDKQRDLYMLESYTDIVFLPSAEEFYTSGYNSWVDIEGITDVLEGARRPGHFRGVATVCTKLFNIVQPTRAYFAQKDAQQLLVIKKMVRELNMPLEIVACPTIREQDGLAMSSRNTYLNQEQRQAAKVLYKALKLSEELYSDGERDANTIRRRMTELIEAEPLAEIDYVSVANAESLQELDKISDKALVSLAVNIGRTRLIDNVVLG